MEGVKKEDRWEIMNKEISSMKVKVWSNRNFLVQIKIAQDLWRTNYRVKWLGVVGVELGFKDWEGEIDWILWNSFFGNSFVSLQEPLFKVYNIHYVISALLSCSFSMHNLKNHQKIPCKREGKQTFFVNKHNQLFRNHQIYNQKTIDVLLVFLNNDTKTYALGLSGKIIVFTIKRPYFLSTFNL